MITPDLSFGVVVLNWNNAHDTIPCLESLKAAVPQPGHVVVIDNGSTDSSVATILRWGCDNGVVTENGALPWLNVIEAGKNRGFAGGNNLGIEFLETQTTVTHVMLLNNDATVAPDFFCGDLDCAEECAGCRAHYRHHSRGSPARPRLVCWRNRASDACSLSAQTGGSPIRRTGSDRLRHWLRDGNIASRPAANRIPAEVYFPLYWEDGEYSFRARGAGFPVLYAPRAKVFHKVGATVGPAHVSPIVAYCQNRLRVFYVRRNYRGWTKAAALGYLAFTKPGRARHRSRSWSTPHWVGNSTWHSLGIRKYRRPRIMQP